MTIKGGYSLRLQQVIQSFGIDPATVTDLQFHFPSRGLVTATIKVTVDKSQIEAIEDACLDVQEARVEQDGPTFRGGSADFMREMGGAGHTAGVVERFMNHVKNGEGTTQFESGPYGEQHP